MLQALTYHPVKLLSFALGVSVLFSSVHAKDISAFAMPTGANLISNQKQGNTSSPDGSGYKINVEHHNHIDKVSLKSVVKNTAQDTPQADAKSLRRNRHSAAKKVAKKQKYTDAWHTLLMKAI